MTAIGAFWQTPVIGLESHGPAELWRDHRATDFGKGRSIVASLIDPTALKEVSGRLGA
jgi:hypothetical protein